MRTALAEINMKNNIKPKEKVLVLAKRYESTDREKAAMEAIRARRSEIPQIRIKVTPTGTGANNLSPDHPNPAYGHVLLMDAFATEDDDFTGEVVAQLYGASTKGSQANEQRPNFMLAVI